ncbi:MarR family transcriptional regulator [uncultured Clostridium sp.]|uniref:MarR family winged helix-turn-helix transcriptional regulator n=1 Tax=uncultured Clostridium sp. TaxID=59620 RepID=UPI00262DC49C|nr:MarR family transcriptional regulator [uncultured Clostridium sp.]
MNNKGGFLINKINFLSGRMFNNIMKNQENLDINHSQGKILFIISIYKELSINELCNELSLRKSTLTSMLDRLELQGYISKKICEKDKRITLISNTEKANKAVKIFDDVVKKMNLVFYENFNDKDIEIFESYLQKIYFNLEKLD